MMKPRRISYSVWRGNVAVNPNNHPEVVRRKADRENRAFMFAKGLKDTCRGLQQMQAQKNTVIKSMMTQYGLKVREARKIYKQA
jgi:hypothetical protein